MEEKRKQQKVLQEQKEREEYSFRPQLVSRRAPKQKKGDESSKSDKAGNVMAVQQRADKWMKSREGKLKAMKEEEDKQKLGECTFKPQLEASNTSHVIMDKTGVSTASDANVASLKSVEKYIEKQKALRATKEESKKRAEHYIGSGTGSV